MTKRVRWECPNGCAAVLGPRRPRRDDVSRYCLACSSATGRLVDRQAPALEKAKLEKSRARHARAMARVDRSKRNEREARTAAGVDLGGWLERVLALRAWSDHVRATFRRSPPRLVVRRVSRRKPHGRLGLARYGENLLEVVEAPGMDRADVLEVLVHEAAHFATHHDARRSKCAACEGRGGEVSALAQGAWRMCRECRGSGRQRWASHGVEFKARLRAAAEELLGVRPRLESHYLGEIAELVREREARFAGLVSGKEEPPAREVGA